MTSVTLQLSDRDKALLEGAEGPARQLAMRILVRLAEVQGAPCFIDITRAHIDGCIYTGDASLRFAEKLADLGGQVHVPTTMNAISIDQRRWKEQGLDPEWAAKAERLAMAYVRMGAKPTFTCTPYLLPARPNPGEHIAWAESNAVAFANGALGARTNRYGDFLDICAGLTGRAPFSGYHLDENRRGTIHVELPELGPLDSSFYPVLGYLVGERVDSGVPVISNLPSRPTPDDLKAFGAAAATSGSVAMFHIVGVTPEAPTLEHAFGNRPPGEHWKVTKDELAFAWKKLSTARSSRVDLIALGNPHFSLEECRQLATFTSGQKKHREVEVLITTSRYVHEKAIESGAAGEIERFGGRFLTDTCFCMIQPPVIPERARTLMTNSAKYAHYGPGLVGRDIYFGSLEDCVRSAVTGQPVFSEPRWLM